MPSPDDRDLLRDDPEPTARPTARPDGEEDDEHVVPTTNVGGASPTPLGLDSGGDLPGPDDDLAHLSEPEPPEPPEVGAVHVVDEDEERAERRDGE